jgi:hypothetical protein
LGVTPSFIHIYCNKNTTLKHYLKWKLGHFYVVLHAFVVLLKGFHAVCVVKLQEIARSSTESTIVYLF